MIVVDSTVLADGLIGSLERKEKIRSLMKIDQDWCSTSLWRYELGNVLWKMVLHQQISSDDAHGYLQDSEELVFETELNMDSIAIFQWAQNLKLTFYDASFVWLAQSRGLKLYTRDQEIIQKCPGLAVNTMDL